MIPIPEDFLFIEHATTVANEVTQINNLVSEW
jgi:hypothetical protein